MRTYVKIEGKEIDPIVQRLARLAVNMSEVCVWDVNMVGSNWSPGSGGSYSDGARMVEMGTYFGVGTEEFVKKCDRIVSKTGGDLGDAAIYFEWAEKPTPEQLKKLEQRIADVINPTKMKYEITNK